MAPPRLRPRSRVSRPLLVALPIASGLLLWASFFLPILVWVAIVPLSLLIRLEGKRAWIYFGAWLGGLAFYLLGTYWVSYCAPWVWIGWLLLSSYLAVYFPVFILLTRICNRRWGVPNLFAIPLVWVALEYVRMHALTGFGWLFLAHSVYRQEWTIQIADIAGVYGVSFVIATMNAMLVELLTLPLITFESGVSRFNPALQWRLAVGALVVCLNMPYGQFRVDEYSPQPGPKCIVVQTNLDQDLKNLGADDVFQDVADLTLSVANEQADVVIWPETAYPYPFGAIDPELSPVEISKHYHTRRTAPGRPLAEEPSEEDGVEIAKAFWESRLELNHLAREVDKPILVGVNFWHIRKNDALLTNASTLIVPEQKGLVGLYEKVHILPFGEFMPFDGYLPFVRQLSPYPADFNYDSDAGEDVQGIHHGNLHLAPLICFEDTVPWLARRHMRLATEEEPIEVLVNQSNEGWFDNSIEGSYHLAAAVFRCVETRRPMVRSSNTGISALVDSCGRIAQVFERNGKSQGVKGTMTVDVPLDHRVAPYVRFGDWLPLFGLSFVGTLAMASFLRMAALFRREWIRRWRATA